MPGYSTPETYLRKILWPICLLSGGAVATGFFFPDVVGAIVSGQIWLIISLLFFGSVLSYLALMPLGPDEVESKTSMYTPHYLLRVKRLGLLRSSSDILKRQDPVIFWLPVGVLLVFFLLQLVVPQSTLRAVGIVQAILVHDIGWVFGGVILLSVLFCFYLLVGPWGEIKLGGPDAEPTYTYPVYFTLFFTAGIAAGIVFWGPAESLFHFQNPPPFHDAQAHSDAAVNSALTYALFHWGFSAWSAYLVIGLPIAYFVYEHGAPLRVSAILTPFLGPENLDSFWGKLVDILAIFATIGGIATSVALVSQQFLIGITFQWGVSTGGLGNVLFVGGLTAIFVISAQSGVHRGIRRIAAVNIVLFGLIMGLLFLLGPRAFVLNSGATAIQSYTFDFIPMSLFFGDEWVGNWTIWNWTWWFSWAPFAGLFLAALSRGRQIRTVVLTGFIATSLVTMIWFVLIGGTSLYLQQTGVVDILGSIAAYEGSEAVAGYPLFEALPLSQLLIFLFLALIIVFMTSSADTSTLIVAILASKPSIAPTTGVIVFWGAFQGIVAVAVLITGSAEALQATAVLAGGPFAIISLVALIGLVRVFYRDETDHQSVPRKWYGKIQERW